MPLAATATRIGWTTPFESSAKVERTPATRPRGDQRVATLVMAPPPEPPNSSATYTAPPGPNARSTAPDRLLAQRVIEPVRGSMRKMPPDPVSAGPPARLVT